MAAFTTHQVAQLLGVTVPTVINWVNQGRLDAHKTPGGHRRITKEALLRFGKSFDYPIPTLGTGVVPSASLGPLCVMVIDPERDFGEMVAEYLMLKADYRVAVADEAMEIGFVGGRLVPGVVLYDPDTPGVSPAKLAAHFREQREDTKLFLLTGYVDSRIEAMAQKLGAEGVLLKPLKLDELLTLLKSLQF